MIKMYFEWMGGTMEALAENREEKIHIVSMHAHNKKIGKRIRVYPGLSNDDDGAYNTVKILERDHMPRLREAYNKAIDEVEV